jgi:hypothetical protein
MGLERARLQACRTGSLVKSALAADGRLSGPEGRGFQTTYGAVEAASFQSGTVKTFQKHPTSYRP